MKGIGPYIVAAALLLALPANADWRGHGRGHGWGGRPHGPVIIHREDPAAGFLGGVVGGVLGSILTDDDPPAPSEPDDEELEPWSKAWFSYCEHKYKSFDPESGTFTGYDGEKKFCR